MHNACNLCERRDGKVVSIKTIAEECGVSIATVSKALNNHSDVSSATKKLVCDTAKRLGYFPNSQARALKTNKTYNVGVLLQDKAHSGLTHSYFSAVLDSFRVEVEKNGYDITETRKNGDVEAIRAEYGLFGDMQGGEWKAKAYLYNSERGLPGAAVRETGDFVHEDRQWDTNFFLHRRMVSMLTIIFIICPIRAWMLLQCM